MRVLTHLTGLADVLADMRAGRIVRPRGLGPYRWSVDDVVAFWRSVRLGIPLGSVAIWHPIGIGVATPAATGRVGPHLVPPAPGAGYLLDGYARLASVAWTLRRPGERKPEAEDLDVSELLNWAGREPCFDLGTGDFSPNGIRAPRGMPGHLVAEPRAWEAWRHRERLAGGPAGTDSGYRTAEALQAAYLAAKVVLHVIESDDRGEVVHAMMAMDRRYGASKTYGPPSFGVGRAASATLPDDDVRPFPFGIGRSPA